MKKILITDILILIIITSFFSIAYATNSPFLDAAQNAIDAYKPGQEVENDALQEYMNRLENEMIYSNAILNNAQNAADKYWEVQQKEQEALNKYEASWQAEWLVEDLKEKLDVYKTSVQIDNKLYLKYSNTEKTNIYKIMTSNAQKAFEKNANYFKKSGANYYDTGRLRTLPIINYTDVLQSVLEVKSASESEATFDIIIKNIVSGEATETYKDGLKIVKKDGKWLIDSLKFKSTVEEFDYYPEVVEIQKEEPSKTDDKKEENKVTENTITEETNKIDNTNVQNNNVENITAGSNEIYISNQITDTTTTVKQSNDMFNVEYVLYLAVIVLTIALIYIIYKIVKHNEAGKSFEKEEEQKNNSSSMVTLLIAAIVIIALLGVIVSYLLKLHIESSNSINSNLSNSVNTEKYIYSETEKKAIKQTIENYYKLLAAKENSPVLMLTDVMGLTVEAVQDPEYAPNNFVEHPNPYKYIWTGIKYKEFAYELWYVSDNVLKNKFPEFVEYKDYLYIEDNGNNNYDFKYEITQNEIDKISTESTCVCNVTVKNSKTGKTMNNIITMNRENSDFVINNVK